MDQAFESEGSDQVLRPEEEMAGMAHAMGLLEQQFQAQQRMLYSLNQMVTILLGRLGGETIVTAEQLERTAPLPINVTPCTTLPGSFTVKSVQGQPQILTPGAMLRPGGR